MTEKPSRELNTHKFTQQEDLYHKLRKQRNLCMYKGMDSILLLTETARQTAGAKMIHEMILVTSTALQLENK